MLKRPSSRRKSSADGFQLNLVPVLDTMVTLIGFLLFTTSFLGVVSIESPFPSTPDPELLKQVEKNPEKPIQLTLSLRENEAELWSGTDSKRLSPVTIPNVTPGQPDIRAIHEKLLEIKGRFPSEKVILLAPHGQTSYDVIVAVMDAVRMIEPTDPPLFAKNAQTGNDEAIKELFPTILFPGLMSTGGG